MLELSSSLAFTKTAYFTYVLVLPMVLSGVHWFQILVGWVLMQLIAGFLLAVIFQPAHVMEDHDYKPAEKGAVLDVDPLTHQLRTTSNFGTGSRVFTWLCGGLNHQIEHHLFPQVSHIHLRNIAPIVKQTAEELALPLFHDVLASAGASHPHAARVGQLAPIGGKGCAPRPFDKACPDPQSPLEQAPRPKPIEPCRSVHDFEANFTPHQLLGPPNGVDAHAQSPIDVVVARVVAQPQKHIFASHNNFSSLPHTLRSSLTHRG